jgi:hypothetical protein
MYVQHKYHGDRIGAFVGQIEADANLHDSRPSGSKPLQISPVHDAEFHSHQKKASTPQGSLFTQGPEF